jgi:hypothetical protein
MKKYLIYLPSIVFNIAEFLAVILIGGLLGLSVQRAMVMVILFAITRMVLKKAMHYKDWKRCFLMTTLFFLSLFIVAKADFYIALMMTVFEALILTGHGNINDMFMWGGNTLNKEVFDWVKFNPNNEKLLKYEQDLKEHDKQKYIIFKYRFREFKSYSDISKLMDIDIQRISDEIKVISHFIEYSIRLD